MKTIEFEPPINPDHTLTVPPHVAAQVPDERPVRVILVIAEDQDDAWARLTSEQFLSGYNESNAIYDELPAR